MRQHPSSTFEAFAAANEDLFGTILGRYYSPTLLNSDLARTTFVMPEPTYERFR